MAVSLNDHLFILLEKRFQRLRIALPPQLLHQEILLTRRPLWKHPGHPLNRCRPGGHQMLHQEFKQAHLEPEPNPATAAHLPARSHHAPIRHRRRARRISQRRTQHQHYYYPDKHLHVFSLSFDRYFLRYSLRSAFFSSTVRFNLGRPIFFPLRCMRCVLTKKAGAADSAVSEGVARSACAPASFTPTITHSTMRDFKLQALSGAIFLGGMGVCNLAKPLARRGGKIAPSVKRLG